MILDPTRALMLKLLQMQTTFRQAVQRSLRREAIDLTFEMLQIMVILWRQDGVNQQELADASFKDKASLTSILNNLQSKELILRTKAPVDRRNNIISLTTTGRKMGQKVKPIIMALYAKAGMMVDLHQTQLCTQYLDQLNNAFKDDE